MIRSGLPLFVTFRHYAEANDGHYMLSGEMAIRSDHIIAIEEILLSCGGKGVKITLTTGEKYHTDGSLLDTLDRMSRQLEETMLRKAARDKRSGPPRMQQKRQAG